MSTHAPNIRTATDISNTFEPTIAPAGPILVATDTSPASDAAFPMARLLAASVHAPVEVVSGLRPNAMPLYAYEPVPYWTQAEPYIMEGRQSEIERQMARTTPIGTSWPVRVRVGEPLTEIVEDARAIGARVIIVGRGRHSVLARVFGGESVLRLLQLSDAPVLAVEPGSDTLPKNVVIATDFSPFSLYAAQVSMGLIAPAATVRLVHVGPTLSEPDAADAAIVDGYRQEIAKGFALLKEHLEPRGFIVETVSLQGSPSERLLEYLESAHADLVVTATHGYGFLRRMVLGSVTSELVRSAPCSVLCVPGRAQTIAAARAESSGTQQTHSYALDVLDAALNAFTTRNAGRSCSIEMDRDDFGAQSLGHGMPLVGATYDKHDRSIALMFGASSLLGEHLSHRMQGCESVHTISNAKGRDQVMRIVHEGGQTLLLLD
ncbi:universal stress protein [Gemmatimonas groenlandica]|uniref:Universal stress protein n=1 Tax=Gemmatimonas groenlandica TaxID=2732249 RepID=A0A6M4IQ35_9BACT|nr:universal stress protein [Gemmatimonas groenlandica]QJR36820.1 universal stress protein [Gemmatimonas groenlandica]